MVTSIISQKTPLVDSVKAKRVQIKQVIATLSDVAANTAFVDSFGAPFNNHSLGCSSWDFFVFICTLP